MDNYNYGFIFNHIIIDSNKKTFTKKSKNIIATNKINNEIDFYNFIKNNHINFPMPILYNHSYKEGEITIEYIQNSITLTNCINKQNVFYYIILIKNHLKNLHKHTLQISNNILHNDCQYELYDKIINRYSEFDWQNNKIFNSIKSVNNIPIKNIHFYCDQIFKQCISILNNRTIYSCIHGDIHLGNILINYHRNIEYLTFIDPKGVFGKTKYYGLPEYDYAKLLFGLSGYSYFDQCNTIQYDINGSNINIEFIKQFEYIFDTNYFNNLHKLLCCSIWLANNSCFIDFNKKLTSLMIGFYYCEKILFN